MMYFINCLISLFYFFFFFLLFSIPVQITTGEAYLVYSKRLYSNSDFNQYAAALYKVVGTFMFGACVSQSLTEMAKFTIGRPRPNFIAVCAPSVCKGYMLNINCTGSKHNVTESRYTPPRDRKARTEGHAVVDLTSCVCFFVVSAVVLASCFFSLV